MIKFKDLESFISEHKVLNGPLFPFDVRTDFVKVTDDTILVPITLQIRNRDVTFNTKDGVSKGLVNIFGRVSTITDHVVQTFEETVQVEQPAELLSKTLNTDNLYWKALPLRPGRYRLDIAIKDVNNPDHVGVFAQAITVPRYDDDQLSASSLILSDKMYHVPSKEIGTGNFIIGNTFVRPRVTASAATPASFHRSQSLNFWMQVYNLGIDEKSKQNGAKIRYEIIDTASNKMLFRYVRRLKEARGQPGPAYGRKEPAPCQLATGQVPCKDNGGRQHLQTGDCPIGPVHGGLERFVFVDSYPG